MTEAHFAYVYSNKGLLEILPYSLVVLMVYQMSVGVQLHTCPCLHFPLQVRLRNCFPDFLVSWIPVNFYKPKAPIGDEIRR
jgi:hypothetical protein